MWQRLCSMVCYIWKRIAAPLVASTLLICNVSSAETVSSTPPPQSVQAFRVVHYVYWIKELPYSQANVDLVCQSVYYPSSRGQISTGGGVGKIQCSWNDGSWHFVQAYVAYFCPATYQYASYLYGPQYYDPLYGLTSATCLKTSISPRQCLATPPDQIEFTLDTGGFTCSRPGQSPKNISQLCANTSAAEEVAAQQTACTNPINSGTGNKYQPETDYAGGGLFPLRAERTYNSGGTTPSAVQETVWGSQ